LRQLCGNYIDLVSTITCWWKNVRAFVPHMLCLVCLVKEFCFNTVTPGILVNLPEMSCPRWTMAGNSVNDVIITATFQCSVRTRPRTGYVWGITCKSFIHWPLCQQFCTRGKINVFDVNTLILESKSRVVCKYGNTGVKINESCANSVHYFRRYSINYTVNYNINSRSNGIEPGCCFSFIVSNSDPPVMSQPPNIILELMC
jgi:hypothetical protein